MTNYLLSIDPSIKNTGFTLWKKELCKDNNCKFKKLIVPHYDKNANWKPIWIKSYSFNKFTIKSSLDLKWVMFSNLCNLQK